MDMDKENILSKKDLEFLQEWILQDRNMRKGKIESDFDKFCEEKCVALENLISAFLKTQSGLVESKKIIVNLTNLCDEWADKYLALKSELAEISDNYARLDEKYDYLQSMHDAVVEESLRYEKEIAELNHQLAKKEKELLTLKEENEKNKAEAESQHQSFIDCFKDKMRLTAYYDNAEKQHNKDKISSCIEKLINVQKYISDNAVYVAEECFGREINDFIDNQIKKIKGEE